MFNPMLDIDRRIEDLQRLKDTYQASKQQPINIFNNTNPMSNDFKAQFLSEDKTVDEIFVTCKTAFIDLKNGKLSIKDTNGDIQSYELILPKDEKDLRIEELERKLKEYEYRSNTEICESRADDIESNEPSTKTTGRTVSKKS